MKKFFELLGFIVFALGIVLIRFPHGYTWL